MFTTTPTNRCGVGDMDGYEAFQRFLRAYIAMHDSVTRVHEADAEERINLARYFLQDPYE